MAEFRLIDTNVEPTPEAVQRIIDATDLVDIRVDQVDAGPVASTGGEILIRLGQGEPQFAYFDQLEQLIVRLEHTLECRGDTEDGPLTTLRVWHVAQFAVKEELEVELPNVASWIQSNVYFLAYPYVRQFFTNLTASMGLPSVVLGYMRREDWPDFSVAEDTETTARGADAR